MGIRTPDLLIANETLYQLSYDPTRESGLRLVGHSSCFGKGKDGDGQVIVGAAPTARRYYSPGRSAAKPWVGERKKSKP